MQRKKNIKAIRFTRAIIALLAVLLNGSMAWADDITVTYDLYWRGGETSADGYIRRADNQNLYTTWHVGVQTLWPANTSHGVNDEYDISIKPSVKFNAVTTNGYKYFKTTNSTSLIISTEPSNQYLINAKRTGTKAVTSSEKAGSL